MKKILKFLKMNLLSAKNRVRLKKFFKYTLPFNLRIIANILIVGWLCDKLIEGILFTACHFALRYKFDKVYHNYDGYCEIISHIIISVSIPMTFRLDQSLLFACISALGICWLGYIIQDRIELKYENSEFKKTKDTEVYYGMAEDLLRKKCKIYLLTKTATDRIVKRYCYNMSIEEIAFEEKVEYETIKQSLRRSRKKLKIQQHNNHDNE